VKAIETAQARIHARAFSFLSLLGGQLHKEPESIIKLRLFNLGNLMMGRLLRSAKKSVTSSRDKGGKRGFRLTLPTSQSTDEAA
jgi:hypothetical protein